MPRIHQPRRESKRQRRQRSRSLGKKESTTPDSTTSSWTNRSVAIDDDADQWCLQFPMLRWVIYWAGYPVYNLCGCSACCCCSNNGRNCSSKPSVSSLIDDSIATLEYDERNPEKCMRYTFAMSPFHGLTLENLMLHLPSVCYLLVPLKSF